MPWLVLMAMMVLSSVFMVGSSLMPYVVGLWYLFYVVSTGGYSGKKNSSRNRYEVFIFCGMSCEDKIID